MKKFWIGFISGALSVGFLLGVVWGLVFLHNRDKELIEYAERQIEIDELREDYGNRSVDELLELPDVRRAADEAGDEFIRKRDEAVQRFRGRLAD